MRPAGRHGYNRARYDFKGGMADSFSWRAMAADDLATVDAIAAMLHPDYPERPEVLAEKLALYPAGCRMLARLGYAFAHPARTGQAPALDTMLGELPADADALHLHDVALLPEARGGGRVAALLDYLTNVARVARLPCLTLVAVHGTADHWRRFGFAPAPGGVTTYADAIYMTRLL